MSAATFQWSKNRRRWPLVLSALVASTGLPVAADGAADAPADLRAALAQLEVAADAIAARGDVPGLAIAVVYRDDVVLLEGFGVREAGREEPVGPDTIFPLASVSKPIAATVVAATVGKGIVDWDTPLHTVDPTLALHDPYVSDAVTLRDLFSHRSGLSGNAGNDLELLGYGLDEILGRLRLLPPAGAFRDSYAYSNYGLTLGAMAVASAAGETWPDLAQNQLYAPLGMYHSSSRAIDFPAATDRVRFHTLIGGSWQPAPDAISRALPAGGVSSTVRDLAAWMRLILAEGVIDGRQIVEPAALAETYRPVISTGASPVTGQPSSYGLGWSIDDDEHGRHVSHSGGFTTGIRTLVDLLPDREIGIVILTNAYPTGVPEGLAAMFFDLAFTGASTNDEVRTYSAMLGQAYGGFIAAISGPVASAPADAVAPLPPSTYVGAYGNDYVGVVRIVEDAGGLAMLAGPRGATRFPLHHHDRDVFYIAPAPDTPQLLLPVMFTIGPDRRATELRIALIGGTSHDRLMRTSDSATE